MPKIRCSTRPKKKFMVEVRGKTIHFGAKGYTIEPGTPKGDNYCARSSGIRGRGELSANHWSRRMWGCVGKKSYKRKALKPPRCGR